MIDHSDFQETDIPFEIPLPEKPHLSVSVLYIRRHGPISGKMTEHKSFEKRFNLHVRCSDVTCYADIKSYT